ncbi:hypothetical protein K7I13_13940 [Brucepastera parasyntrophica]|uniref:hypothetical protein n=1 Tax=Brucepastera parasyntrophica TaxID=2880008 RepID=UPI00210A091B|nr:hypothetical protein [Brucepastera parasyntrophica]ULQ59548.1 hypothetical protein K7I13_13940 [Brucepastera parasyntrophica]
MKNILYIIFILIFSAPVFSLGGEEGFSLDYIKLHKEVTYNNDVYYIGVEATGFHEKAYFVNIFLNECIIDENNYIISGNLIYDFYIENKFNEYGQEINNYTDISIDFEKQELIIEFDDGSIQIENIEVY